MDCMILWTYVNNWHLKNKNNIEQTEAISVWWKRSIYVQERNNENSVRSETLMVQNWEEPNFFMWSEILHICFYLLFSFSFSVIKDYCWTNCFSILDLFLRFRICKFLNLVNGRCFLNGTLKSLYNIVHLAVILTMNEIDNEVKFKWFNVSLFWVGLFH